jgi:hypothetical protein
MTGCSFKVADSISSIPRQQALILSTRTLRSRAAAFSRGAGTVTQCCARSTSKQQGLLLLSKASRDLACRAHDASKQPQGGHNDPDMNEYLEVKVDSVRVNSSSSVVYLRILSSNDLVLQVHIGEHT